MIFDPVTTIKLYFGDDNPVTVKAPEGCHLRIIDNAWGRPRREDDVVRLEEVGERGLNVAADYLARGYMICGDST